MFGLVYEQKELMKMVERVVLYWMDSGVGRWIDGQG